MPAQILRDYQQAGLTSTMEAFREGARSVLLVLPTGGGKTSIFSSLGSDLAQLGRRSVIIVHRRELATQASNRFREFGTDFGFIMAGKPRRPQAPVQIASVQTLVRRQTPPAELVICDEAHLSTAKTWQTVLDNYPRARILGVTATPWRLGGKPLVGAYDRCIVVATPKQLRERGFLCDYAGFSYKTPDLSEVKTTGGEYNDRQSAAAMSLIVDNVVEEWGKHAAGISTVVFAVTVEHSRDLTASFRAAGVSAEHLDGATPQGERDAILKRVADGRTLVLCNVGVAVEGLDIPRLKCCVLARPTKSLARAIQMMGRVRRPWNDQTARIHDHAFVIKQHGLPDDERDYTLNAKPEKPPSFTTCTECLCMYRGNICPTCSHENEPQVMGDRELNTVKDAEQFEFTSEDTGKVQRPPVEVNWGTPGKVVEGRLNKWHDEQTQYGKRRFYLLNGAKRDYTFAGTTMLNAAMRRVAVGNLVRVTYLGTEELPGDKQRKLFKVEIDDGRS